MQGARQEYVIGRAELSIFTLRHLGIGTENIRRAAQERRSKARHGREEPVPSGVAPPPPPPQSNWQRLFTRLDDIEHRLERMDTRLEWIEYQLGIPPPHASDGDGDEDDE